jgi:hypothetical protein
MADIRMLDLSKEMGFSDEQRIKFQSSALAWEAESRTFDEAVRHSETVAEGDLALRINARDDRDDEDAGSA